MRSYHDTLVLDLKNITYDIIVLWHHMKNLWNYVSNYDITDTKVSVRAMYDFIFMNSKSWIHDFDLNVWTWTWILQLFCVQYEFLFAIGFTNMNFDISSVTSLSWYSSSIMIVNLCYEFIYKSYFWACQWAWLRLGTGAARRRSASAVAAAVATVTCHGCPVCSSNLVQNCSPRAFRPSWR